MEKENSITVIHLVWLPSGIEVFKRFIGSYIKFSAGCEHELLLIFNGVRNSTETNCWHSVLLASDIKYTSIEFRHGQDLECYFKAAEQLTTEYMIVLNSYAVILSNNWLLKYREQFSDSETMLVGATASCQSYYSSVYQKHPAAWETDKGFLYNFRKYKLFVKAFFYWRFLFKPFPSPHLRTNAFMIKRTMFLQLKHKPLVSKFAAYQFESGRNSMTSQLLKKGYKVVVLDRYGKTYEPAQWKQSATFWINDQENLLVADNQTRMYTEASTKERKEMTRLAWGTP